LTALDSDPYECDPKLIGKIPIRTTVFDGKVFDVPPEFVMRRSNFAGFVSHDLNGTRSHDANEHGCACEVAGFFATYVSTCAWAA